jgi:hypothetical protein
VGAWLLSDRERTVMTALVLAPPRAEPAEWIRSLQGRSVSVAGGERGNESGPRKHLFRLVLTVLSI